MKLSETRLVLIDMLNSSFISIQQKEAIKRALFEVEITIENGDESNL